METVSLTGSAFTALTPPTGTKGVVIILGTATSLTLKGATGDTTGIKIAPASNPVNIPFCTPLGASPSLGILNGESSAQSVKVVWL